MPTWQEYKKQAKERGSLAHELYVVLSTPGDSPEKVKEMLPAHLDYQAKQEAAGTLFLAGPVSDPSGDLMEGVGQIIYQTGSLEEARAIADADPMHASGARSFTLRRWLVNEGALTLSVSLSAQSVTLK